MNELSIIAVPHRDKVQLFWPKSIRWQLIANSAGAPVDVRKVAQQSAMECARSDKSLAGEVVAHALKGWDAQTNPMDIEMHPTRWSWVYSIIGGIAKLIIRRS